MSIKNLLAWIKKNTKTLRNSFLGLLLALSLSCGIIYHNKAQRLSEELKIANNNIEAYQDIINDSQQASAVLKLDMSKLKDNNDKLIKKIDSIARKNNIKTKEISMAATQKQLLDVTQSKVVS